MNTALIVPSTVDGLCPATVRANDFSSTVAGLCPATVRDSVEVDR